MIISTKSVSSNKESLTESMEVTKQSVNLGLVNGRKKNKREDKDDISEMKKQIEMLKIENDNIKKQMFAIIDRNGIM